MNEYHMLSLPELESLRELQEAPLGKRKVSSPALEHLFRFIQAEHQLGRRPLFVLGAGISAGQVPFLSEMAAHLSQKISAELGTIEQVTTPDRASEKRSLESLQSLGERIASNKALRSDAAEFFFTLQGSASQKIRQRVQGIWEEFSSDLLSGGQIRRDKSSQPYNAIQAAAPTACHKLIATQLANKRAWCISFNFDRLTAKAVHEVPGDHRGCAVLHTQEQVDNYFASSERYEALPAVFKVRGDVFYASCSHPGCSLRQYPVPLHSLLRSEGGILDRSARSLTIDYGSRNSKRCPECSSGSLVLQLSFPGFRAKEEEAFPLLRKIASYIHHRLSAIIIIGLSGHWDDYVLEFLSDIASRVEIPIVDVKPDVDKRNPIAEFLRVHPEKLLYLPINLKADAFAKEWEEVEKKQKSPDSMQLPLDESGREGFVQAHDFDPENAWFRKETGSIEVNGGGRETKLALDELKDRLENLIPHIVKSRLASSAQLAIDNIVLVGAPATHNRWNHSLGAATIGVLWTRHLMETLKPSLSKEQRDAHELTVGCALLLHDYGHLPFSHLAEQIIDEINWVSPLHERFGSEFNVLYQRLFSCATPEKDRVDTFLARFERRARLGEGAGAAVLLRLIGGFHAVPWQSAILNSPVDADKVDYVFRDVFELSRAGSKSGKSGGGNNFPFQTRLPHGNIETWLAEFFSDQYINCQGLLCFDGRSAMALAGLLEERMYLYRHLYKAPEVRLAERMAAEFVRQYLIQGVWAKVIEDEGVLQDWSESQDLRGMKNYLLRTLLEEEYLNVGDRDLKEWRLLTSIREKVCEFPMDAGYRELLDRIWDHLHQMKSESKLSYLRSRLKEGLLVESPFYFQKRHFTELRRIIRPLQHQYCCDVLFDLVSLPNFLSGPRPLRLSMWDMPSPAEAINILVPSGPAEEWNFRSSAQVPLTDDLFRRKSDEVCMVYIFDPFEGDRPHAYYALDKFVAACKREGLIYSTETGDIFHG